MRRRLLMALVWAAVAGIVSGCLWGAWEFFDDVRTFSSQDITLVGVHSLINGCFSCLCLVTAGMVVQLAIDMKDVFPKK